MPNGVINPTGKNTSLNPRERNLHTENTRKRYKEVKGIPIKTCDSILRKYEQGLNYTHSGLFTRYKGDYLREVWIYFYLKNRFLEKELKINPNLKIFGVAEIDRLIALGIRTFKEERSKLKLWCLWLFYLTEDENIKRYLAGTLVGNDIVDDKLIRIWYKGEYIKNKPHLSLAKKRRRTNKKTKQTTINQKHYDYAKYLVNTENIKFFPCIKELKEKFNLSYHKAKKIAEIVLPK